MVEWEEWEECTEEAMEECMDEWAWEEWEECMVVAWVE